MASESIEGEVPENILSEVETVPDTISDLMSEGERLESFEAHDADRLRGLSDADARVPLSEFVETFAPEARSEPQSLKIDVGPVATPVPAERSTETPKRATAIVGGVEYSAGGWGRYESERRRARWDVSKKNEWQEVYAGRSYVGGSDAAKSLLDSSRHGQPLQKALMRLAEALRAVETKTCRNVLGTEFRAQEMILPALTSDEVLIFAKEPNDWMPEELDELLESIAEISFGQEKPALSDLPPLPARFVKTSDGAAMVKLEEASLPWVQAVEEYRARAATFIDAAAASIEKKCGFV